MMLVQHESALPILWNIQFHYIRSIFLNLHAIYFIQNYLKLFEKLHMKTIFLIKNRTKIRLAKHCFEQTLPQLNFTTGSEIYICISAKLTVPKIH